MIRGGTGTAVKLDDGVRMDSTSSPAVFSDGAWLCDYFYLWGQDPESNDADATGFALHRIAGLLQLQVGYPNEEALWWDSEFNVGHGVYEIRDSSWINEIFVYNRRTYGSQPKFDRSDSLNRKLQYEAYEELFLGRPEDYHHYFVGGKETSLQFLAQKTEHRFYLHPADGTVESTAFTLILESESELHQQMLERMPTEAELEKQIEDLKQEHPEWYE